MVVLTCGFLSLASTSAGATAGSYQVSACNLTPEAVNNSWTWTATDSSVPSHYAEHANCPDLIGGTGGASDQEGGLSTTDGLGLSRGAQPGTSAGWTFAAPVNTTITAITYERYIGHRFDGFNDWSPALRADGTIVPGETCLDSVENGDTCAVGGPPGEGGAPEVTTGLSAHQLSVGIVCQAPSGDECVTGATEHKVWAAIYGATVTVDDPTPPTLGTPSGALWGPGEAGGFHKGTESVTVSAQDVGGGVQSIVLAADGQPVETYSASCDFTFAQPCPLSTGPQILTLPTTQLSDGPHTLTLVAIDAAGNRSPADSEQITVENNPPPLTGLAAVPTLTGGLAGGGSGAGGSGSDGSGGGDNHPPAKATVHVTETLHGRELVVHVSGPVTGRVRVSFTGRLRDRTVASGAQTAALKGGRLTVIFKLGPRTAADAVIRVSARLGHQPAVTSTLRRSSAHHAKPKR
jgi:hypothetical protein